MRDYSVELMNIQSGINHLKGLISRTTTDTSVPTVDFMCDMFDRPDAGVLSGYWADTAGNWTLRGGKAICQATASQPSTILTSRGAIQNIGIVLSGAGIISGYTPAMPEVPNFSSFASMITNVNTNFTIGSSTGTPFSGSNNIYAAKTSTADMNIKVTFFYDSTVVDKSNTFAVATRTINKIISTANFGAVYGNASSRSVGTLVSYAIYPGGVANPSLSTSASATNADPPITSGSTSVTAPAMACRAASVVNVRFGDAAGTTTVTGSTSNSVTFNPILTPTVFSAVNSTPLGNNGSLVASATGSEDVFPSSTIPVVNGSNTLLIQAVGNTYMVYMNGALIYTETTPKMIDRSRVGISANPWNMLGAIIQNNLPYTGVTSFKAWPVGQAEPLDQSGHGTYASGYIDRYHSTGSYNPLA